jgi:hypothetical protein
MEEELDELMNNLSKKENKLINPNYNNVVRVDKNKEEKEEDD